LPLPGGGFSLLEERIMNSRQLFRALTLFVMVALAIPALSAEITGVVVDAVTGNPVADANVTIVGLPTSSHSTGLGGKFVLANLTEGSSYSLSVTHIAYKTATLDAVPKKGLLRVELIPANVAMNEVLITAGRGQAGKTPGALTDVSHIALSEANSVMEPPMLAPLIPNAVSFNWGGGSLGPTHLRIRGFDMDKQSVTINGIPLTDPEDHNTYWQDTPDLLSNVHDVQVERGVSNASSGPPGLAGGLNLITSDAVSARETALTYLIGTYNTERRTFMYRSGLVDGAYTYTGRFSRVASDGYRDHSGAVEWSYFLAATRYDDNFINTFETWGGDEETQMNFTAIPKAILDTNRTYNPEANYDLRVNGEYYDGEKDHFQQPHYALRTKWRIAPGVNYEQSLYFIRGTGYYEEYKRGRHFEEYNLTPFYRITDNNGAVDSTLVDETDLIRQKAVDKYEVGWMPRLKIDLASGNDIEGGLEVRSYRSGHYGRVLWARDLPLGVGPEHEYNRWNNNKVFLGGWGSYHHHFTSELSGNLGFGLRHITYEVRQKRLGAFPGHEYKTDWTFLTPRAGLTWAVDPKTSLFGSVAMSGLEPVDNQLFDPDNPAALAPNPSRVKPQRMTDFEFGARHDIGDLQLGANLYAMFFTDEIVMTGQYDLATDEMVYTNAPTSQHLGIELTSAWKSPVEGLTFSGDLSLDRSTFGDFTYHYVDSIDGNWNYLDQTVAAKGNRIPLTPSYVANLRCRYEQGGFSGNLNWQGVSRQYLDPREENAWSLDPYGTVGASLSYDHEIKVATIQYSLNAMNLLGVEYEPFGWTETVDPYTVNPSGPPTAGAYLPMYIPAAGRTILGGVTIKF